MNTLPFIVSLMAVVVIDLVTATNNFGFGSSSLPSLSYPSLGLWSGGWGSGYSHGGGFGGFKVPSSYGYVPKGVQKFVPVFLGGGYGGGNEFGNDVLIVFLVIFLVLFRMMVTYRTPTTPASNLIISG